MNRQTPSEAITALANELDTIAAQISDPRERLDALRAAADPAAQLAHTLATITGRAMKDYVDEIGGATTAARELGLSRNRIYMMMEKAEN